MKQQTKKVFGFQALSSKLFKLYIFKFQLYYEQKAFTLFFELYNISNTKQQHAHFFYFTLTQQWCPYLHNFKALHVLVAFILTQEKHSN